MGSMQALTVVLVLIFLEACASSLTSTHVPSLSATPLLVNRHLVLSCLPGLRLRGGTSTGDAQGGIEAMQDDGSSAQGGKDPRDWAEADVLAFVESLRQKFGSKTDTYLECFKDNDVDGKVLLALDDNKLEKMGIKSLGHREHIIEAILSVRGSQGARGAVTGPTAAQSEGVRNEQPASQATHDEPSQGAHGMMRGPTAAQFAAARAAECTPAKNPPPLIKTEPYAPPKEQKDEWKGIAKTAWDQKGHELDFYMFLDGVGNLPKDAITVSIGEWVVDVRIHGLNGTNYMYCVDRLHAKIKPEHSFWKVRKDRITLKLYKVKEDIWMSMLWDKKKADRDEKMRKQNASPGGPEASLMQMMADMYEEGDLETKQTIGKAWATARDKTLAQGATGEIPASMPFVPGL